ncbi:transposase [Bifidobacterium longum]|uniref:transposase n=2 Tax=Bifidobacterium longum TaxID=216816 RepID=UPI001F55EB8A|nr:transposase [Bifidobacterium longum]
MPSPFGGLTSIGVDEIGYRKGHTCITVVVDHERHRAIWAHDGYGRDVFGLFFQTLTPEQRASIRVVAGDGDEKSVKRMRGVRYTVLKNPGKLTDRRSEASGNLRDTDPKGRPYRS